MSGKATFAKLTQGQGDVIKRRKCNPTLLLNTLQQNKNNLVAGLYSKVDLSGVCVVSNGNPCSTFECPDACATPTIIDPDDNFYFNYTIYTFTKSIAKIY
jgi:hypothetical protein